MFLVLLWEGDKLKNYCFTSKTMTPILQQNMIYDLFSSKTDIYRALVFGDAPSGSLSSISRMKYEQKKITTTQDSEL